MPDRANVVPFQQKVFEMLGPSLSPKPPRGTLGQGNTSGPSYFDLNGNPITSIVCGGSFTFDVPGSGLSQVYLKMVKNGQPAFDGLFPVPMPGYITSCENDVGNYQLIVYDPNTGIVLGQTTMSILPTGSTTTTTPGSGIAAWFANLSTAGKLGLVAGLAIVFMKGKK